MQHEALSSESARPVREEESLRPQRSDAGAAEENRAAGHRSVDRALAFDSESPYFNSWEVDVRALPVYLPELFVPEFILNQRIVGKVTLHVLISATGRVDRIEVLSSSHPGLLEDEAFRVVSATRFNPAIKGGLAVRSAKRIEVVFDALESVGGDDRDRMSR